MSVVEFSENNWLEIKALGSSQTSVDLEFRLRTGDFRGTGFSRFERIDTSAFLAELDELVKSLSGTASLGVDGLSSCLLTLSSSSGGQFALRVIIRTAELEPCQTVLSHVFYFTTSSLDEVCNDLRSSLQAAGLVA